MRKTCLLLERVSTPDKKCDRVGTREEKLDDSEQVNKATSQSDQMRVMEVIK